MFCLHADAISAGICDSFWSDFLLKRKNGGKKQLVLIRFYAHEENWREITAHFDPFLSSRTKKRIKLIWEMVRYEILPALKWMQERYSFWAEKVVDIGHFLFDPFFLIKVSRVCLSVCLILNFLLNFFLNFLTFHCTTNTNVTTIHYFVIRYCMMQQ